ADIAMRSGFNSLATFNRVFKTSLNCTPSAYRKSYLG
ncbi:MAG: AraC family transcriptional regulator, partial [Bacteroidaceae bacterium]|nr:AraC family transcriptional regulator [Bacteroidaceae bacterium]